ncbi:hypothetical protein [Mycoplasma struthionis]|uniref:Uncharacterized protein n=1 Tax=Mycoplasma struthionis TaxID=538220 RepID=A0A502M3H3_9MOLU|nr:hypothetical protein [Mycoplasma struthionis]TPI01322.1 hypothetical protein FJM01_02715 [Mycoplasma struthionis]
MINVLNYAENTSAVATKSNNYLLAFAGSLIILIACSFFLLKYIVNFKKSIKKTQEILGKDLVIKYLQGFNFKSNGLVNFLIANILALAAIIFNSVMIGKIINRNEQSNNYFPAFLAMLTFAIIWVFTFNLLVLTIYLISYNVAQYKHKKDLAEELHSLRNEKQLNDFNYPEQIKLDVKKIEQNNPVAPRVLSHFIIFYNNLFKKEMPLIKTYQEYLNQTFKIRFFNESLKIIEDQQKKDLPEETQTKANDSSITSQIEWMKKADDRAKILKETEQLTKMDKKEFNKHYDEYLATVRSQDPLYQQIQKNSWLTYRDGDIEDLFYNSSSPIFYSYDDGKTILEKPLNEFLNEYLENLEKKILFK